MKMFLFSLVLSLCSLNVFAEVKDQPIDYNKMLATLSHVAKPQDAVGKTFNLGTPVGKENSILHILPENAVEMKTIGQGVYQVKILKAEPFYDMDFYKDTGSVSLDEVLFSWTDGGTLPPDVETDQACVNLIKFPINGMEFNQDNLNKYKASNTPYKIEYNHSILKQSQENEFTFTRLTNDQAIVTLTLYKKDGSVYVKKDSNPVAICSALNVKLEPKNPQWSAWSGWNSCSATCGGGKQSHERTCLTENVGVPCIGNSFEESSCNEQACPQKEVTPFSKKQSEEIKEKNVSINIISSTKLSILKRNGTANYEAALSNPFNRTIRCNIDIESNSGWDTKEGRIVDHKSHIGVVVQPNGLTKVTGTIKIMKTGDDLGFNWTIRGAPYIRYQQYYASGCVFLD